MIELVDKKKQRKMNRKEICNLNDRNKCPLMPLIEETENILGGTILGRKEKGKGNTVIWNIEMEDEGRQNSKMRKWGKCSRPKGDEGKKH